MDNEVLAESIERQLNAGDFTRSYVSPSSAVLCLSFSENELRDDLLKMQRSGDHLFDRHGPGARWYHELTHYWQTFYNHQLCRLAVCERGNIAWLVANLSSHYPAGQITLPLPADLKGPFGVDDMWADLSVPAGPMNLSVRHLLEGEATFESLICCRGYGNSYELAKAFTRIEAMERKDSHLYCRAFLSLCERFLGYSITLFPIACHLAVAGVLDRKTGSIGHPSVLFQDAMTYFSLVGPARIDRQARQDLAATYEDVVSGFCEKAEVDYCGAPFTAKCIRESKMLQTHPDAAGTLFWPLLTQEAEAICLDSRSDLFLSPVLTGNLDVLADRLGMPLYICKNDARISAYFDPHKPEYEDGAIFSHALVQCYRAMFDRCPPAVYCPHSECPYRSTALCHLFPWIPDRFAECWFPRFFEMAFGVSLARFSRH